ncbi:MAG: 50S ribosomal protein L17 [Bacteroidales bacterium]|nr:50S ribosomal protein L17 [Bacteroidales bacterium]MCF8327146.1 50S ribosomal protein L17 [Bacteroidales bacterium]
MRHQKRINSLSRTSSHRKAMLSNMATSLILHKRISTTVPKARVLRQYVEPLITRAKEDTMHSRRVVFRYLKDKEAVNELFREISVKVADRPGGYTRILKTGFRPGDNTDMCIVELVDYNDAMLEAKEEKKATTGKKRTRRGRRGSSGQGQKTQAQDQQAAGQENTEAADEKQKKAEQKAAEEAKNAEQETKNSKPEEGEGTNDEKKDNQ